jgi:hypothetical protein
MRIAYKNIIDDLSAGSILASSETENYPIENIQDQRLTTRWKSDSSATAQTVLVALDTLSEYPTDPAGTTYKSNFATTDGWAPGGSSCTLSAEGSRLKVVGTGSSATLYASRPIENTNGRMYLIKVPYDPDITEIKYFNGSATVSMSLVRSGEYLIGICIINTNSTTIQYFYIVYASAAIAGAKTAYIENIYIGTGAYLSNSILDNSENNLNGTVYACIPFLLSNSSVLLGNGINSYVDFGDAAKITKELTLYAKVKAVTVIANSGIIGKYSSISDKRGYLLETRSNNYPQFSISSDGTATAMTSITQSVALYTTAFTNIVCTYVPSTSMKMYRDGVLVASTTSSVPSAIYDTTETLKLFAGYTASAYSNIYIAKSALYQRALTESEAIKKSTEVSFNTEDMGLVGSWEIDKNYKINTISLLGHNILSGTQVKIQANNSNEWSAPSLDETFTYIESEKPILKFLSSTYIYKYWRFYFYGQGSIEVGRMWLGEYITIDPSSLLGFKVSKKTSDTVLYGKERSKFGLEGSKWRRIELSFPPSQESLIKLLSDMFDEVGIYKSFIFCNFDTIRDYTLVEPLYGSFQNDLNFTHSKNQKYSYDLQIEEDL